MYKKISITICIVISLFFIVPLLYFWWTMEPVKPPDILKGPHLGIYLKNLTTEKIVLLHDIPNSEYVIDASILSWNYDASPLSLSPSSQSAPASSIVLECHANVPMKWSYVGYGRLIEGVRYYNKREVTSISDNSTYWFTTSLEFLQVSEHIVGKYLCSSVEGYPEIHAQFHIYAKGLKTFTSKDPVELKVEANEETVIPCPLSSPERSAFIILRELLKPLNTEVYVNVESSKIVEFDPKAGFKLSPNVWGTYVCVDTETNETSGIIKTYRPLKSVVTGSPVIRTLTAFPIPKNDSALKILCEATENVTLNFNNFVPFKRRQVYHFNTTSDFPFSSRIILRNEWFKNLSTVDCVTVADNRLLRTWKYLRTETSDKINFVFSQKRKGYQCCTHSEKVSPRLTHTSCFTQTECEMRRACLNSKPEGKCPYPGKSDQPIYEGDPGCALAKVDKNPSGLLDCTYANSTKSYLYFYDKKTGFQNFTSSDFSKKKIPFKDVLRVTQSNALIDEPQQIAAFHCYGPKLFFANGFQWTIERIKGEVEYILNQSEVDDHGLENVYESVEIPISKLDPSATVTCMAPLVHSHDWIKATVAYERNNVSS